MADKNDFWFTCDPSAEIDPISETEHSEFEPGKLPAILTALLITNSII